MTLQKKNNYFGV